MTSVIGKRSGGFTLVELSLVGLILGLVSFLCWPSFRMLSKNVGERAHAHLTQTEERIEQEKKLFGVKP